MKQQVQAIYENGVLRPLEPLGLSEKQQVAVTVHSGDDEWVDANAVELANQEHDSALPLVAVREQLSSITGSLAEAVIAERGAY